MTVLINGSPKHSGSASGTLLDILKGHMRAEPAMTDLHGPEPGTESLKTLAEGDVWIFAFPLYVDSVPSHLLACLTELEPLAREKQPKVYAVVNCGFYEGRQNRPALEIIENFCARAGCRWCGGVGTGGGGALSTLAKLGKGPAGPVDAALRELAENIGSGSRQENRYVTLGIPRLMYKLAGEMGWRKMIKANGGRARDLDKRIT